METSKKKRLRLFIIIAAAIVTVIAAAIITSELTLGHIVSANVICTGATCSTPVFSGIDLKVDLNNFSFSVSNAESLAQVKKLADRAKSIDRAEKLNPFSGTIVSPTWTIQIEYHYSSGRSKTVKYRGHDDLEISNIILGLNDRELFLTDVPRDMIAPPGTTSVEE